MDSTPAKSTVALDCGQPFRPPTGDSRVTVTGRFPATVPASQQMVAGTVEVTGRKAVRGVLTPRADVFLVRNGRVATMPMAQDAVGIRWDLAPGETGRLPAEAILVSCEPGGAPLAPGAYELYARVMITPDDGTGTESFGGPWPIEVR